MQRLCFALFITLLFGSALAHIGMDYHLEDVTLCVDPSSVFVNVETDDETRRVAIHTALQEDLPGVLENVLRSTQVGAEMRSSCAHSGGFTLLFLNVRYLDPETYLGFAERSYSYVVSVQVGEFAPRGVFLTDDALPEIGFASFESDIYSEVEGDAPIETHLTQRARARVRDLAVFWWEDNAPAAAPPPYRLGLGLSGAVVVGILLGRYVYLWRRKNRIHTLN